MVFENALNILSDCLNLFGSQLEELSDLKIICDTSSPNEVERYFSEKFNDGWERECIKELEAFGYNTEEAMKYNHRLVVTIIKGNEILIRPGHLVIREANFGDAYDFEYRIYPLADAFFETKKQFPDILFEGFVITDYSDLSYGEVFADEFLPDGQLAVEKNDLVQPNIGKLFAAVFLDSENPEEVEWFSEKFEDPMFLEYLDPELGESELWDTLISDYDDSDLEEVCDALCFYSSYLSDNILKRAIDHFAEISDEMAERLEACLSEDL